MFSTHWATNYCPADSGAQLPAKSRYLLVRHSSLEPARLLSSKRDTTCSPHPCSPARTVLWGQCETVSVLSTESVVTSDWNISSALYTADWSGLRSLRPFRGSLRRVGGGWGGGGWGSGGVQLGQLTACFFLILHQRLKTFNGNLLLLGLFAGLWSVKNILRDFWLKTKQNKKRLLEKTLFLADVFKKQVNVSLVAKSMYSIWTYRHFLP